MKTKAGVPGVVKLRALGHTRAPKQKVTHAKLRFIKKRCQQKGMLRKTPYQHQVKHHLVLQGGLGNVEPLSKPLVKG